MCLVTARKFSAKLFHDVRELSEFVTRKIHVLIRNRQMRGETMNLDLHQGDDFLEMGYCLGLRNSHSAHPGIDDEIYRHGRPLRDALELPRFLETGNGRDESALGDERSLRRQ